MYCNTSALKSSEWITKPEFLELSPLIIDHTHAPIVMAVRCCQTRVLDKISRTCKDGKYQGNERSFSANNFQVLVIVHNVGIGAQK